LKIYRLILITIPTFVKEAKNQSNLWKRKLPTVLWGLSLCRQKINPNNMKTIYVDEYLDLRTKLSVGRNKSHNVELLGSALYVALKKVR
jgi:hypothetical protein